MFAQIISRNLPYEGKRTERHRDLVDACTIMGVSKDNSEINEISGCRWCDTPIGLRIDLKDLVGARCFNLLSGANIPINEIISGPYNYVETGNQAV